MAGKRKGIRLGWIRRDYSYLISEAAERINVHPDTVLRWVREDGLKHLPTTWPYFIYGQDLYEFLNARRLQRPKGESFQIYCFKCRQFSSVNPSTVERKKLNDKVVHVSAQCVDCLTRLHKNMNTQQWTNFKSLLGLVSNQQLGIGKHEGVSLPQAKCREYQKWKQQSLDLLQPTKK